jgi:hypothetical protein
MSWRAFGRAESASPHGKPKRLLSPHPWRLGRLRVAGFIARVEPLAVGLGRDAGGNPVGEAVVAVPAEPGAFERQRLSRREATPEKVRWVRTRDRRASSGWGPSLGFLHPRRSEGPACSGPFFICLFVRPVQTSQMAGVLPSSFAFSSIGGGAVAVAPFPIDPSRPCALGLRTFGGQGAPAVGDPWFVVGRVADDAIDGHGLPVEPGGRRNCWTR